MAQMIEYGSTLTRLPRDVNDDDYYGLRHFKTIPRQITVVGQIKIRRL